jgi:hypothetical protein
MSDRNPNCDGEHCVADSEVRVYPLGGGANLILCRSCFAHENAYRRQRAAQTARALDWPLVEWETAERYPREEPA